MNALCPYCEKKAKKSYGYKDMVVCVNKECFYYLKDDVRNFENNKEKYGEFNLILGLQSPKLKQGFLFLSLTDDIILKAMEEKDKLEPNGVKRATIKLKDERVEFFYYTQKTAEMTDVILRKKYEEVKNIKIRNWKSNKKIEATIVHLVISKNGIRIQAKHADTYQNLRSFLVPWSFF